MSSFVHWLPAPLSVTELAARLPATPVLRGDTTVQLRGIAGLAGADTGTLAFCESSDLRDRISRSKASAIIVARDADVDAEPGRCLLVADDPRACFIDAVAMLVPTSLRPAEPPTGIHPGARVHPDADVSAAAAIGDGVTIGPGTHVARGATIYSDCVIGAHCTIGPGAVIGWVGLSSHDGRDGLRRSFPHLAGVRVGDRVEIGANTCVCRGLLAHTVIGNDVRIGSLVYLSHGIVVGDKVWVSASCSIAGHANIGERVLLGVGAVVVDNVAMEPGTMLGGGGVLTRSAQTGEKLVGVPARHVESLRRFGPTPR